MSFTLRIILSLLIVKSRSLTIFSAARQSFNTGLSRFGYINDFSPTALAASECISSDAVDESKSVHLQLNAKLSEIEVEVEEEEEEDDEKGDSEDNANTIVIYEYFRPNDSTILLAALGSRLESTALKYFANETFGRDSSAMEGAVLMKRVINRTDEAELQKYWRLWDLGLLVSYPNDFLKTQTTAQQLTPGPDILRIQVASLVTRFKNTVDRKGKNIEIFKDFLEKQNVLRFKKSELHDRNETLTSLKDFAVWFRSEFPYYYNQCPHCNGKEGIFYGHATSNAMEKAFYSFRTELYVCSNKTCDKTYRFPRYNDVSKVIETRMGRCGEYSVLMMQMLESLDYDTKWVVDWADHLWCEVLVPSAENEEMNESEEENDRENGNKNKMKPIFDSTDSTITINPLPLLSRGRNRNRKSNWVHVDPCEAAVNENYIYESWGKSQNYIVSVSNSEVYDVTEQYTRNFNETVLRRSKSEVNQTYLDSLLHDAKNEIRKYTSVNLNATVARQNS